MSPIERPSRALLIWLTLISVALGFVLVSGYLRLQEADKDICKALGAVDEVFTFMEVTVEESQVEDPPTQSQQDRAEKFWSGVHSRLSFPGCEGVKPPITRGS